MNRRTWAALMLALIVAGIATLVDPTATGSQIIAAWVACIAALIIANCRVWPATEPQPPTTDNQRLRGNRK